MRAGVGWWWVLALSLCGCHFSRGDHPSACKVATDCDSGSVCKNGYCLALEDSGASTSDAGGGSGSGGRGAADSGNPTLGHDAAMMVNDAGGSGSDAASDSGMTGTECDVGLPPEDCYSGPKNTKDVGVCRGGQRACINGKYTPCLGQVLPSMEMCNGKDDNCDGEEDEFAMDADCSTAMKGVCMAGALVCRGNYAVCEPVNTPSDEVCNGKDDDCDGTKDNAIVAAQCYPPNTDGCTAGTDGTLVCHGLCQAGHSACSGGADSCPDAVTPITEACTASGLAGDEDCDEKIDEGCACTDGQTRDCYSGPMGTETNLPCHHGTQTCTGPATGGPGTWGDCTGEVTPQRETCDNLNVDDDCDGTTDNFPDIPGLGEDCLDDTKVGICHQGKWKCQSSTTEPVCVGAAPQHELCDDLDQNCDGDPSDGYDLSSDPNNCGMCGNACTTAETCCNGVCTPDKAFRDDPDNCGSCGHQCGTGHYCCWNDCLQVPPGKGGGGTIILPPDTNICVCKQDCGDKSCCGDNCFDLDNDDNNCGWCGHVCPNDGILPERCCGGACTSTLLCGTRG